MIVTINDMIVQCSLWFLLLKEKSTHVNNWPKFVITTQSKLKLSAFSDVVVSGFFDLQQWELKLSNLKAGLILLIILKMEQDESLNISQCVYMHVAMDFYGFSNQGAKDFSWK